MNKRIEAWVVVVVDDLLRRTSYTMVGICACLLLLLSTGLLLFSPLFIFG